MGMYDNRQYLVEWNAPDFLAVFADQKKSTFAAQMPPIG